MRFFTKKTASLAPAEVWRGRSTISSVIETVHVLRERPGAAYDWTWHAGECDGSPVSERTLGRWRDLVRERLIGSALSWLGPQLRVNWSTQEDEAAQLARNDRGASHDLPISSVLAVHGPLAQSRPDSTGSPTARCDGSALRV